MRAAFAFLIAWLLVPTPLALAQQATPTPAIQSATPAPTIQQDDGGLSDGAWSLITALVAAVIGVAGGLLGTLVGVNRGHLLSEKAALRREEAVRQQEEAAQARQRQSVRTLVLSEVDENLLALRIWWEKLSQRYGDFLSETSASAYVTLTKAVAGSPLPAWSARAWDAQQQYLVPALSDNELAGCHRHYAGFAALESYTQGYAALSQRPKYATAPMQQGPLDVGIELASWWPEIYRTVNTLRDAGNPLRAATAAAS